MIKRAFSLHLCPHELSPKIADELPLKGTQAPLPVLESVAGVCANLVGKTKRLLFFFE
jgi:hypothetical protein